MKGLKLLVCLSAVMFAGVSIAARAVIQPTFTATTLPSVSTSSYAVAHMSLADLDGDGVPDIVSAENSGNLVIRYLHAEGDVARTFRVNGFTTAPRATAIGDFNQDGRPDIAVVVSGNNQVSGGLYVLVQNADGTFGTPFFTGFPHRAPAPIAVFNTGQDPVVGDVNEDGYPDLVVPANSGGTRLFFGNGNGFDATPAIVHPSTFNNSYARLADVDGDGHLDLVVNNIVDPTLSGYSAGVHVLAGAGDGTFGTPMLLHARLLNQALATGDLNGDGLDDIVVAGASAFASGRHVAVFLALPGGGFADPLRLGGAGSTNIARVVLADLNGDGTPDIISTPGNAAVQTFLNDGPGGFTNGPTLPGSAYSLIAGVLRADAPADVFAGTLSGTILAFLNDTSAGDITPPVVTVPDPITVEAEGPDGALVSFTATAVDDVDGTSWATCAPSSGSLFVLGTTTVTCTASDAAGNEGRATFDVTVVDTTAPSLTLPGGITVDAAGPGGAVVTFSATAMDLVDGAVAVTCAPASGSTFPVGETAVACSASDSRGNSASGSFTVLVRGASGLFDELLAAVQGVGPGKSLPNKVASARAAYLAGDLAGACDTLTGFINEVRAQAGKHVPNAVAPDLIERATRLRQTIGC
jgi:hypothetical protein